MLAGSLCLLLWLLASTSACGGTAVSSTTTPATQAIFGNTGLRDDWEDVQKGNDEPMGDDFPNTIDLIAAGLAADGQNLTIRISTALRLPSAPLPSPQLQSSAGKLTNASLAVDIKATNGSEWTVDSALQGSWTVTLSEGQAGRNFSVTPVVAGYAFGDTLTLVVPLDALEGLTPHFTWSVTATSTLGGSADAYRDQIPGIGITPGATATFVGTSTPATTSTTMGGESSQFAAYRTAVNNLLDAVAPAFTTTLDWARTQKPPKEDVLAAIKTFRQQAAIGLQLKAPPEGAVMQEDLQQALSSLQYTARSLESAMNGSSDDNDLSNAILGLTAAFYTLCQINQQPPAG
jgi:hypothetical protein